RVRVVRTGQAAAVRVAAPGPRSELSPALCAAGRPGADRPPETAVAAGAARVTVDAPVAARAPGRAADDRT
ncbi:hypothetical protein, partial [Streptomyces buecherae]|uniref:hypothetical protein n=1 Tax=Streptomyces buecherae TaxID=2763006 RepID=UPI001C259C87